ncbi:uncharacterized protein EI90DRAFT_640791 [Cantharellus anzutake]|uniref:uncharacterized protein n=1 Tax=Cantharellus anzutake TaxID=1750568 RepID=UPI001907D742|nr:uncharacterized protein EI90DRAFT_640791 [Cantharellus anzutake]KAF8333209.1 hypothetical protein EI90DRAFT_640791 [Cantharellus anzutake]
MSEVLVRQHDAHVDDPHVQPHPSPSFYSNSLLVIPRRVLGFPPGAILALSMESALSLSRPSRASSLHVTALRMPVLWVMNLTILTTCSYLIPGPVSPGSIFPGNAADKHLSGSDTRLQCVPFYGLPPSTHTSTSILLLQGEPHCSGWGT